MVRGQASFVSDRQYLQQPSNSGTQRASPAVNRPAGDAAASLRKCLFPGPVSAAVELRRSRHVSTPPEVGYVLPNTSPFGMPLLLNLDTNFVNFYREQGFAVNRMDFMPGVTTDVMDVGRDRVDAAFQI